MITSIKLKEYEKAEEDCTLALELDATHLKVSSDLLHSYSGRAARTD